MIGDPFSLEELFANVDEIEALATANRDARYAAGFLARLTVDELVLLIADAIDPRPFAHPDRRIAFVNGMHLLTAAPIPVIATLRRGAA